MNTMATKRKPAIRVKSEDHRCKQVDQIKKLNLLLLGNGNPKDGYVYKVIDMSSQMKDINEKLTGIGGIVKELHEESIRKKEVVKTDKENKSERRAEQLKMIQTFMFVVGAIGLCLTAYFGFKNGKGQDKITQQVDDLGTPVVVNKRSGEFVNLPKDYSLKMWPKDFIKDTTNKK